MHSGDAESTDDLKHEHPHDSQGLRYMSKRFGSSVVGLQLLTDVAFDSVTSYCHDVIVAAVCMQIMPMRPAKISVRRFKRSTNQPPMAVKIKYVAVKPSEIPSCAMVSVTPIVSRAGVR